MKRKFQNGLLTILTLGTLSSVAHADPGAVETAATAAVTAAKTAAENVLVVVAGILAAFVLYKLIRRAVNKA